MKFIHRFNFLVTLFHTLLLLIGGIMALFGNENLLFIGAYAHMAFGWFQVVLSLVCLFFLKRADEKSIKLLLMYYGIVVLYFLIMYAFSFVNFNIDDILIGIYLGFVPMLIAFYFVYTTRSLMRSIENI